MDEDMLLPPRAGRRPRPARLLLVVAVLLGFALGAGVVAWFAWREGLDRIVAGGGGMSSSARAPSIVVRRSSDLADAFERVDALDSRAASLEDRLSRLDVEADAASGNAARVENLLVAVTVRRAIERGEPLGALADQLRVRFAEAQPEAVRALVAFTARPVTLAQLDARLDSLGPALAATPRGASGWTRLRREVSSLFVVRSEPSNAVTPEVRIDRAKLMLASARADEAIAEVARLPGAAAAAGWNADTRRYGEAQQALDTIELAAMDDARGAAAAPTRAVAAPRAGVASARD